jgi:hypothetical protein
VGKAIVNAGGFDRIVNRLIDDGHQPPPPAPPPVPGSAAAIAAAAASAAAAAAAAAAAGAIAAGGVGGGGSGIDKDDEVDHKEIDPLTRTDFTDVHGSKYSKLLEPRTGWNSGNYGRFCLFRDQTTPYEQFMMFLQHTDKPIGYRTLEMSDNFEAEIKAMFLQPGIAEVGGTFFLQFKKGLRMAHDAMGAAKKAAAEKLIAILDEEAVSSSKGFLLCWEHYVGPYKTFYLGLSLTSPFAPDKYVNHADANDAMKMVCGILGLDYDQTALEMRRVRLYFGAMPYAERKAAHADLMSWLDESMLIEPEFWSKNLIALHYIGESFAFQVTSHYIEQQFSSMDHATKDRRSTTGIPVMMAFRHLTSAKKMTADAAQDADGVGAGNFLPKFLSRASRA